MALGASSGIFVSFLLVAFLNPILEPSFGYYVPQAAQEYNELMSMILNDLDPITALFLEQLAWQRKKCQTPYKSERNPQFAPDVMGAKPHPVHRQGSTFRMFIKSSQRKLLKNLKRSLFRLSADKSNLEGPSPSGPRFETTGQTAAESGSRPRTFPKKREAVPAEWDAPSAQTVRLTITALQTQERLSKMVDRLSEPSNSMSKEERLTYMHELLDEVSLFMELLLQQIRLQPPPEEEAGPSAAPSAAAP